jgi:hypothetical protein
LQALTTLNEQVFVECSQALGLKTLTDGGQNDEERLTFAFRRCVARVPTEEERLELLTLLKKQKERFTKPGAKPLDVGTADPKNPPKLPDGATAADLAAWTIVSRVLLNLDETLTKE